MDNICHTLVGAAFGEAGLKRRTRLGNATLMIAANLPDVDVLVFATSAPAVAFRRGWTHGVAAQALLPIALTGIMLLAARWRPAPNGSPPLRAGWLLLLSYLRVLSHVLLDLLNSYGIRLLTPFDWRWLYGDAVFIIDPWLWLSLGLGVWLSRRLSTSGPARTALIVVALYVAAMGVSARVARERVLEAWNAARPEPPRALMVGPVPVTPFRREIIVDAGDYYQPGTFGWPRRVVFEAAVVPKNDRDPYVAEAREAPHIRGFLVWSRFPVWTVEAVEGGTRVTVGDMRFVGRGAAFQESVIISASD